MNLVVWDSRLFLWFNGLSSPGMDYIFGWTSYAATPVLFAIVFVYMWIWDAKKCGKKFITVLLGGLGGALFANLIKLFIHRRRPYAFFYDDIEQGKVIVNSLFNLYTSNSFPSSHTALVFAVVFALNRHYKNRLLFLYVIALIPALSRVYVGAHFPSDIMMGILTGIFGAAVTLKILEKKFGVLSA